MIGQQFILQFKGSRLVTIPFDRFNMNWTGINIRLTGSRFCDNRHVDKLNLLDLRLQQMHRMLRRYSQRLFCRNGQFIPGIIQPGLTRYGSSKFRL